MFYFDEDLEVDRTESKVWDPRDEAEVRPHGDDYDDDEEEREDWELWDDEEEDLDEACGDCLRPTCGETCDECGAPLCHMCAECGANFCDKCPTETYELPGDYEVKEGLCAKLRRICGRWLTKFRPMRSRLRRTGTDDPMDVPF